MSTGTLSKVSAMTAGEVCQRFKLEEPARALLKPEAAPGAFLDLLIAKEQYIDAIRFLAHALPKPEAIWWSCSCARHVAGANTPAKVIAALEAVEKWLADPSEENRRGAQAAAEAAELSTPAGCTAMAVFWSGGSMAPPNVPAVPPGENLTAHGVAGAVMLAAVQTEPAKAAEKYRKFFELGLAIGNGTNRWKESAKK